MDDELYKRKTETDTETVRDRDKRQKRETQRERHRQRDTEREIDFFWNTTTQPWDLALFDLVLTISTRVTSNSVIFASVSLILGLQTGITMPNCKINIGFYLKLLNSLFFFLVCLSFRQCLTMNQVLSLNCWFSYLRIPSVRISRCVSPCLTLVIHKLPIVFSLLMKQFHRWHCFCDKFYKEN